MKEFFEDRCKTNARERISTLRNALRNNYKCLQPTNLERSLRGVFLSNGIKHLYNFVSPSETVIIISKK